MKQARSCAVCGRVPWFLSKITGRYGTVLVCQRHRRAGRKIAGA